MTARIGVYGGTFDPPHGDHVAVATAAVVALDLDELLVVPAGDPYHKPRGATCAALRAELCDAAFGVLDRVRVDRRDLGHSRPSYTVELLDELHTAYGDEAELVLVVGADTFAAMPTWRDHTRIGELATVAVAGRDGTTTPSCVVTFSAGSGTRSSTQVRAAIGDGGDPHDLLPGPVADLVTRHGLYRSADTPAGRSARRRHDRGHEPHRTTDVC